jgi:hypothetical protein
MTPTRIVRHTCPNGHPLRWRDGRYKHTTGDGSCPYVNDPHPVPHFRPTIAPEATHARAA